MTSYRFRLTKVLEDGSEVELANVLDNNPWYVAAALKDWVSRLRRLPRPPLGQGGGQTQLGRAA